MAHPRSDRRSACDETTPEHNVSRSAMTYGGEWGAAGGDDADRRPSSARATRVKGKRDEQ